MEGKESMSTTNSPVDGLKSIAESPAKDHGQILTYIAFLESELAQWKACASSLATAARMMGLTDDDFALTKFENLKAQSK